MRGHVVRSLVLGSVAALLLAVGPVAAKIPYFSIEVSPPAPVEGDEVLVTVLMWDDADHTQPATWSEAAIVGLLEFRGDAGRVPITLHRRENAIYRAEVALTAGNWRLVAYPLGVARTAVTDEGYSTPIRVTVSERWDLSTGAVIGVAAALSILGVLLAGRVSRGMRQRRLGSATGSRRRRASARTDCGCRRPRSSISPTARTMIAIASSMWR